MHRALDARNNKGYRVSDLMDAYHVTGSTIDLDLTYQVNLSRFWIHAACSLMHNVIFPWHCIQSRCWHVDATAVLNLLVSSDDTSTT